MTYLNFISYNVRGLNNPIKRKKIFGQLKKLHCSVALLQETHLPEIEHLKLKREWVEQVYSASSRGGKKRGVAILFSKSVYYNNEKIFQDEEGRFVMVIGTIGGTKITILNIYAPNEDCPNFFKKIAGLVADKGEGIILVGGDFNCILNTKLDRLPVIIRPQSKMSKSLSSMMSELGLVDVWRHFHPNDRDFTFMSQMHGSYTRIDYFCMSKTDLYRVKETTIEPITISDHSPVVMKIDLGLNDHFKYWRLNVSLLTDTRVKQEIHAALSEYFAINDDGIVSPSVVWDASKATIRGKIISIGSRIKKQRLIKQQELENEIKSLEREHKQSRKEDILKKLKETKQQLDEVLTHKAEGSLRYISRKYYEMGNKSSRLLAFQLRKAQSNRIVAKIRNPETNLVETHPKEISNAFAKYYEQLYKAEVQESQKENINDFLKPLKMSKLSNMEAAKLAEPITEAEIRETIAKLKNNRSPGTDGFSGEYYKCFVNELTPILCKVYNYTLNSGDPPKSWSEAIIAVLQKEGKDPVQCTSYRPISLLCVDYKILTSILATRIQNYIKKLIKPDQTGFIIGRHGTNNIRRALNLQSIAARNRTPSMLLSLDAEKAFDRVDWLFLEQTLLEMGFGETLATWINTLYKNPKSKVRVNGCCSDSFNVERGVRQGDSLSPILFALSIEPLAEAIRQNAQIQGLEDEGGTIHKIALFADDILIFIKNPLLSIPALMQCLNKYSSVSGYKINENKSEAMMISGNWPIQLNDNVSFHWSKQGFRYLGIVLTANFTQLYDVNYNKLIRQIKNDITRWEILPLSLLGRVETVRMNLLPRMLFLFQSLPVKVPITTFNMLDKLISKFIWQRKRPRIRLKILLLPKEKGGLGLPNLKYYYWAAQLNAVVAWIKNDQETGWVQIEQSTTKGISLSTLPFINMKSVNNAKIENEWIKHTLEVWTIVRKKLGGPLSVSRAMPIMGNMEFPPSVWDSGFRRWADKGLSTINSLFNGIEFKSFTQLQEQCQLPSNDLYRYFQIRHYITNHKERELLSKNPNNIEDYFITLAEKHLPIKKHVSHIYKRLINDTLQNTESIKGKWELELNILITDNVWEELCINCHKGLNSQLWREFDWKLKIRYFNTPLIISRYVKEPNVELCWRNCGNIGDHSHIFWDCPVIQEFWKRVKEETDKILQVNSSLDPLIFLLGAIPQETYSSDQRYMLRILLLIAKKMITVNWKDPKPPTINQWVQRLKRVYTMERMTASLQLKMDTFEQRWNCITLYLED